MNKKTGIVVLFWNDYQKTITCLESIFKQKKINFSLILVDNNSNKIYSKKILNWLKKSRKKIILVKEKKIYEKKIFKSSKNLFYIKNKHNYGCGLGHNPGYQFCIDNKFNYIARIDNDMIVPKLTINNLIKRMEKNSKINAISPKIMYAQNPDLIWWRGAKIGQNLKLQRNFGSHYTKGHSDNKKYSGLINSDAIAGCASIMKTDKLKKIGLSDPDFFYGEEDVELSVRMKDSKDSLKVDLNEKTYHYVSHTVGKNWAKTIYYNYKYRLVLIKKIGSVADKIFGYSIFIFKLFIMFLLLFRKKYSSRIIQIFYAGLHFFQKKYGYYDRKKYGLVDNFFSKINKKTSIKDIINNFNHGKKI